MLLFIINEIRVLTSCVIGSLLIYCIELFCYWLIHFLLNCHTFRLSIDNLFLIRLLRLPVEKRQWHSWVRSVQIFNIEGHQYLLWMTFFRTSLWQNMVSLYMFPHYCLRIENTCCHGNYYNFKTEWLGDLALLIEYTIQIVHL